MAQNENVVNLSHIPFVNINAPEGSSFGGRRQRVGTAIGARKLGYSFFTVPPGKAAFPYHAHSGNEEMIYIIEGVGVLRMGKGELAVAAESVIACPPGLENAHQLINTGSGDLRYLVVSTMEYPEIAEYPDSNKIGAYTTTAGAPEAGFRGLYIKDKKTDYYDGENGREIDRIKKAGR